MSQTDTEMPSIARAKPPTPVRRKPRVYIYTVPKAGTYLMDAFLTQLGYSSTGWHISLNNYLDTTAHDEDTNRVRPGETSVARNYLNSFRRVPAGGHAFGHFNPLFVPPAMLRTLDYRIIAVKRHPREVLVSEFIDFRHRRSDVGFVSAQAQPDHRQAFVVYLRDHAPVIRNICMNWLLLLDNARSAYYREIVGDRVLFIDFKQFLDAKAGPEAALRVEQFLNPAQPRPAERVKQFWSAALAADNKTRSDSLDLPYARDSLWTPEAVARYEELGFPQLASHLGY